MAGMPENVTVNEEILKELQTNRNNISDNSIDGKKMQLSF